MVHYLLYKYIYQVVIQLSKGAAGHSEGSRLAFMWHIGAEAPEQLVFTDERAIDLRTTYRQMGWSYKGSRANTNAKGQRYGHIYQCLTPLFTCL